MVQLENVSLRRSQHRFVVERSWTAAIGSIAEVFTGSLRGSALKFSATSNSLSAQLRLNISTSLRQAVADSFLRSGQIDLPLNLARQEPVQKLVEHSAHLFQALHGFRTVIGDAPQTLRRRSLGRMVSGIGRVIAQ